MGDIMKRIACILLLLIVAVWTGAPVQAAASRTWTVLTGGGVKDTSVVSNSFRPRVIEVAVGDTVQWDYLVPWTLHTVTFTSGAKEPDVEIQEGDKFFINPQVFFPAGGQTYDGTGYRNSGIPEQGASAPHFTYKLTFMKAGTYKYFCTLHGPDMSGTVIVRDRVSTSPASLVTRGKKDYAATLKSGQAGYSKWRPQKQGNKVVVPMIGDPKGGWSILRFTRAPLVIKRGTTVTWDMRDTLEAHTVTFFSGEKTPDFLIIQPQQQGPPRILENPLATNATKDSTYDGTGYRNSGLLFAPGTPGNPPTKFSLTFTKPGRYEYTCVIHAPWGMNGVVIVQ